MFDLLKVSLLGAVMILVIIGIRALLKNRLHRTVFLILWLMAAVRLAVPVIPSSVFSVYNLLPQKQLQEVAEFGAAYIDPSVGGYVRIEFETDSPEVSYPVANDPLPSEPVTHQDSMSVRPTAQSIIDVPWILWLMGAVLCFLYFLWVHVRARLEYRFALPEEGPEFLGKVRLKRSDRVSAPLVYGFFRPVILLPENFPKKDSPEYEQVLWHELTHVRSGDLWYKLGMLLVTCIHWFNPLVWIMLRLSTQDMEIRCDARVIRKLGGKRAYALTLVQAEVRKPQHFAEAAFAFSLTELRLMAIAKAKVYLPRSIALFVVLSLVLTCCFSTGPSAKAKEDPSVTEPTEATTEPIEEIPTEESTEESTEETAPLPTEPPPTVYMDEEMEMAYLLSCDYEEYGSSLSLSMKEGQTEIMALKLPEYAVFSVDANGKDKLSAAGEYAHDEGIYYLSLRGLKKGDATIYIFLVQKQWMKIHVEIQLDPYYRVPDWHKYEAYGSTRSFSMYSGSANTATLTMRLPDRATYSYTLTRNGEAVQGYDLSVSKQYNYGNGSYDLYLSTMLLNGEAVIYFYIDGLYWCKVNVTVKMGYIPMETPSQGSSGSSQGNSSGNSSSGVYDYLKSLQSSAYPYQMKEQYSGGPIQVFSTIYGKNGQIIRPGVYWPGQ